MSCIDSGSYTAAASASAAATKTLITADFAVEVAMFIAKYTLQNHIAGKLKDLANRKLALAQAVHDHAKKFWPKEKDLAEDWFAEIKHEPQYLTHQQQFSNVAANSMFDASEQWIRECKRQCITVSNHMQLRFRREEAATVEDFGSFGFRFAENRAESLNDRRYSRQYTVLGIGKEVLGVVNAFDNLASNATVSTLQTIMGSANSGLSALGYVREQMTRPDGWGEGIRQRLTQDFVAKPNIKNSGRWI